MSSYDGAEYGFHGCRSRFGFLSGLTSLVGSKTLTRTDIQPALDKMKDHLISEDNLDVLNININNNIQPIYGAPCHDGDVRHV